MGCPELKNAKPIPSTCVKKYEKCKLPSGPLGVCDMVKCAAGEKPPCLKCISQH